ncbi:hypothetical protein [Mycolicibacterium sp.]|uniref:hypothetical protein n=1 Tax=Mycolicibacterium sp. TaxID=2320850 RepID=UPI0037CC70C7
MSGPTTTRVPMTGTVSNGPEPFPISVTAVDARLAASGASNKLGAFLSSSLAHAGGPGKCRWHHAKAVGLSDVHRAAIAWIIAEEVMHSRGGLSRVKQVWIDAVATGTKLAGTDQELLKAFISDVFGLPGQPKSADHLIGHVGEWLWYLHARDMSDPSRTILRLEPPKFTVTEQGADGLVIYSSTATGTTFFRLWETKKQTGNGAVSAATNKAYTQVGRRAKEYLAKLTAPLSLTPGEVGDIGKEIADLWLLADPRAGVGVSVASDRVPPPSTCFTTMGSHFAKFKQPGQLEGLLVSVEDLHQIAVTVREYLWTAL